LRKRNILAALVIFGGAAGWFLTSPKTLDASQIASVADDADTIALGKDVFWAAGCASCHIAPKAEKTDAPILAGGQKFPSDFGTFLAPNISQDETHGIGSWTFEQFANAVQRGVSPEGQHYFPAFPYTAYAQATPEDIAALYAFMKTLPADATPSSPHEVSFPFSIRRSVGGWKLLNGASTWQVTGDLTPSETRGRYLVEALAHCTECHTPRNAIGLLKKDKWLSGAPDPSGKGTIPNITPGKLDWNDLDLVNYLTTGFTPEFDTAGGHMVAVIENLAKLPPSDAQAITDYLRKVPAIK
jgi:mono/diheme cytochrome c family protein